IHGPAVTGCGCRRSARRSAYSECVAGWPSGSAATGQGCRDWGRSRSLADARRAGTGRGDVRLVAQRGQVACDRKTLVAVVQAFGRCADQQRFVQVSQPRRTALLDYPQQQIEFQRTGEISAVTARVQQYVLAYQPVTRHQSRVAQQQVEVTLDSLVEGAYKSFRIVVFTTGEPPVATSVQNTLHFVKVSKSNYVDKLNQVARQIASGWLMLVEAGDQFLPGGLLRAALELQGASDVRAVADAASAHELIIESSWKSPLSGPVRRFGVNQYVELPFYNQPFFDRLADIEFLVGALPAGSAQRAELEGMWVSQAQLLTLHDNDTAQTITERLWEALDVNVFNTTVVARLAEQLAHLDEPQEAQGMRQWLERLEAVGAEDRQHLLHATASGQLLHWLEGRRPDADVTARAVARLAAEGGGAQFGIFLLDLEDDMRKLQ
nr:hypothetical protein [Tanacetum cinerariifolium]